MSAAMKRKTYDPVRGVRIPASLWKQVTSRAKAKHVKPSDVIRHALISALSSIDGASLVQSPTPRTGIAAARNSTARAAA